MRRLLPLLLASLLTGACGHKAPPRPLLKPLPKAVRNLELRQLGDALRLSWRAPQGNQDGSPLGGEQYAVFRMSYDPADECPECRDTSTLLREVDPRYLRDVQLLGDRYVFLDRAELEIGRGYRYRVQAIAGRDPGEPAHVQQPYLEPLPAPQELAVRAVENFIRLSWKPVAEQAGMRLLGYNLYRGRGEQPIQLLPINHQPVADPGYDDLEVEPGQDYRYAVSSVWSADGTTVESRLSPLTPGSLP